MQGRLILKYHFVVLLATGAMVVPGVAADKSEWVNDSHGCEVLDRAPELHRSFDWSGKCVEGKASGEGVLIYHGADGKILQRISGSYSSNDGSFHGLAVEDVMGADQLVWHWEGPLTPDGFKGDVTLTAKSPGNSRVWVLHDFHQQDNHAYGWGTMRQTAKDPAGGELILDFSFTRFIDLDLHGDTKITVVKSPSYPEMEGWTIESNVSDSGRINSYVVYDADNQVLSVSDGKDATDGPLFRKYKTAPMEKFAAITKMAQELK